MSNHLEIFENRAVFAVSKLEKYFKKAPNTTVSDIGAGYGNMEQPIKDIGGTWQPFDYYKKMDFSTIWDVNEPAPAEAQKPGVVILLEVLEHFANPKRSLQNIADHMETGGYLILCTPNPQSSKNRFNLLLKGVLYAFQEKHLGEYHVFTPWQHIVKHFLKETGFEFVEYSVVDTVYRNRKTTSVKDWFKKKIEQFIEKKDPYAVGMSYGMVAKKVK